MREREGVCLWERESVCELACALVRACVGEEGVCFSLRVLVCV
ncbi:MAG: hypothetical protein P4L40_26615 [Terracidiphilus sp.]|nr:hypothetical protein [Terracidiphilus sp.]